MRFVFRLFLLSLVIMAGRARGRGLLVDPASLAIGSDVLAVGVGGSAAAELRSSRLLGEPVVAAVFRAPVPDTAGLDAALSDLSCLREALLHCPHVAVPRAITVTEERKRKKEKEKERKRKRKEKESMGCRGSLHQPPPLIPFCHSVCPWWWLALPFFLPFPSFSLISQKA